MQLFVRQHAQGLSLTPGGQRLFNEAKQILHHAASLTDLAGDIRTVPRGPISIGCLNTVAPFISAAIRRSFEADYPDAEVTLREAHQAELLHMLGRAEIDIAITYDLEIPSDIEFQHLIALPPYVMVDIDHPLAHQDSIILDDMRDDPMILLDLPLSREYFLSVFHAAGICPNIAQRKRIWLLPDQFPHKDQNCTGWGGTDLPEAIWQSSPDGFGTGDKAQRACPARYLRLYRTCAKACGKGHPARHGPAIGHPANARSGHPASDRIAVIAPG